MIPAKLYANLTCKSIGASRVEFKDTPNYYKMTNYYLSAIGEKRQKIYYWKLIQNYQNGGLKPPKLGAEEMHKR